MTADDIILGFSAIVEPFEMAHQVVANISLTELSDTRLISGKLLARSVDYTVYVLDRDQI
jgi:hypothetical protein